MGTKQKLGLLGALAAMLVALLVMRHKRKDLHAESPAETSVGAVAAQPQAPAVPKASPGAADEIKAYEAQMRLFNLTQQAGLMGTPVATDPKGNLLVPFQLEAKRRCPYGDIDWIKADLKAGGQSALLLTVEPLSEKGSGFSAAKPVSEAELENGFTYTFHVPTPAAGGLSQLGLYLCLDAAHDGTCRNKKVVEVSKAMTQVMLKGKGKGEDKIYFFQYLQAQAGQVAMPANALLTDAQMQSFGKLTRLASASDADGTVARMKLLTQDLRSVAPRMDGKVIHLVLPMHDKAACSQVR